jgi:tRNA wybutosine-synthesizing protein 3
LAAGFRESGAVSLGVSKSGEVNPLVAVRSAGYSFDAIIGYQNGEGQNIAMVDEVCLQTLVGIANERFQVNSERISRFRMSLLSQYNQRSSVDGLEGSSASKSNKPEWEDSEARKRRKRKEGLARQKQLQTRSPTATSAYVSEAEEGNDQLGAAFDSITIADITS